jgi:hypothetical protein
MELELIVNCQLIFQKNTDFGAHHGEDHVLIMSAPIAHQSQLAHA